MVKTNANISIFSEEANILDNIMNLEPKQMALYLEFIKIYAVFQEIVFSAHCIFAYSIPIASRILFAKSLSAELNS